MCRPTSSTYSRGALWSLQHSSRIELQTTNISQHLFEALTKLDRQFT